MKKLLAIFATLAVLLSATACGSTTDATTAKATDAATTAATTAITAAATSESATETEAQRPVIGVSLLTREHVFYNAIEESLIASAATLGVDLLIQDANKDAAVQMNQVQDFITKGVNAIILCPTSSAGIKPAVELANKNNIPVFTMDIQAEGDVVSHVSTDNYAGGKLAGDFAAKMIGEEGEIAIIGYDEVQSCVDRSKGFTDALEAYPNIKVVDNQNTSGSAEKGANIMQDFILKHPDLKLVFGNGSPWSLSAYQVIKTAKMDIMVIGFDGSDQEMDAIKENAQYIATIAQNPELIGSTTLEAVVDYLKGVSAEANIGIAPIVIDKTNVK